MGLGKFGLIDQKLYKLVSIKTLDNKTITDPFELMDNINNIAIGSSAKYIEVEQVGSTSQWAGGKVTGVLPTTKDIQEYLEEKKDIFSNIQEQDVDDFNDSDWDMSDNPKPESESENTKEEVEREDINEDDVDEDDFNEDDIVLDDDPDVDDIVLEDDPWNEVDEDDISISFYQTEEQKAESREFKDALDRGDKKKMKEITDRHDGPLWDDFFAKLTKIAESGQWDRLGEPKRKKITGPEFFNKGSIAKQAKSKPSDATLEKAWDNLTPKERLGAANVMGMHSAQDLIAAYNKTNNKVDISVSKYMENLKCNI
jgi:hypothetical protein